jgi:hypothetical protein
MLTAFPIFRYEAGTHTGSLADRPEQPVHRFQRVASLMLIQPQCRVKAV